MATAITRFVFAISYELSAMSRFSAVDYSLSPMRGSTFSILK